MKVLLLHNPTAGSDQPPKNELISHLSRAGCEVSYLETDDDAMQHRMGDAVDALVVAGGDGTVAKVLSHVRRDMAPVTFLPMGTANNLSRALGIKAPIPQLIAGLRHGRVVPLDVGVSEGPWGRQRFFESVGFGAIAFALKPVNEAKLPSEHKIQHGREAMSRAFHDMRPARVRIRLDDELFDEELLMLEVSNIASLGPRLCLAPSADPGDGYLHVAFLPTERRQAMLAWLADPDESGAAPMRVRQARRVEVTWQDTSSHVDDFFHDEPRRPSSMRAWLEPGAVKVLVPACAVAERHQPKARVG